MINTYSNSRICVFLIKNYDIKIFSLSIFINAIISRLLFDVIISPLNMKNRDRYLIKNVFNIIMINIKLCFFFIKILIAYFVIRNVIRIIK